MVKVGHLTLTDFPLLLAPMEDVSDPPFRALCKEHGCDLMYTEFISSEGLIREAEKSLKKLEIFPYEQPIGVQIFGAEIESMVGTIPYIESVKPDLLDINFGCPVQKVVCKNAGAGMLKDVPLLVRLTKAVVDATRLPVTVKTRLGWDESTINILDVAERLQDIGIQALTIHARTRKQMYKGSADWSWIARVKENPRMHIPIFGNGDINSPQKALEYKTRYGVDGIMIGRAAIGNPWIFNEIKQYFTDGTVKEPPELEERVNAVKRHVQFSVKWKGPKVGIFEMRRHYAPYFRGLENISIFRERLVQAPDLESVLSVLDDLQLFYQRDSIIA
jgi:nifR3 family TIM-barrel protein